MNLEAEFDCLMVRAGIVIPEARRAGALAAYAELREQVALVRQQRDHTNEPSNVFRLSPA